MLESEKRTYIPHRIQIFHPSWRGGMPPFPICSISGKGIT